MTPGILTPGIGFQDSLAHTIGRRIDFPENWAFEFTVVTSYLGEFPFVLEDDKGDLFTIQAFKNLWGWTLQVPGADKKSTGYRDSDRFRLTKNGDLWKLYVNDTFITSTQSTVGKIKAFRLTIPANAPQPLVGEFLAEAIR